MRPTTLALAFALLAPAAHAQTPITLDQTMADPDWIGPPVERAWWAWDGRRVQYALKRAGSNIRDTWQQPVDGGAAAVVDGAARADLDAAAPAYDAQRARMAFVRNGDVFVRDLRSGALTQVTRTDAAESRPQWSLYGDLVFRAGNDWYRWRAGQGVAQAALVKAEKDPAAPPKADDLRERQLAMIATLRGERERREALRAQEEQWRRADPTRAPAPVYLGDEVKIVDSALSPDGAWLLVVTEPKNGDAGQGGKMPKYVTESGYEEFEEVRTRVGRNPPLPHKLWLVDVANGKTSELKFDALPGIGDDPLAALRKAAKQEPLEGERPVRIETDGDGTGPAIHWSMDGRNVAVLVRAIDNKDRWIAGVDLAKGRLVPRDRLTDAAWINWNFNDFGWTPDGALWFLSERSGWSHLYLNENGRTRALTSGKWEVSAPQLGADGRTFYFVCNRSWPGDYEVCAVDRDGGAVREVTALDGVEDFALSPDGGKLLVRHSDSYLPPQLAVLNADGSGLVQLTDTRTPQFKAREWIEPEYVQVPSKHGAGTIWGKFYGPKNPEPGRKYPVVMFVHGAGYLQNVSDRYPNYFREQMFHNLLVQQGYIVLDLDYRASEGYGRDWRTAIYRQMGHPELEDYLDGLDWLAANKQGDRDRAGIYGGSYGGFMTFMALFRAPGTFKAGAALRPVTDWSQYNHEYTSNILNTPTLDPEAYKRSSPIEYADRLQDHLLIAHGMIDDNVFFKDSVMLAQRLIELRKDKWELAPYPMERHSFVHPDSWYDEYRRIYELFERTLK
ncbi:S9 family peptidase [Vulcaniibacterium tengchongense]|uniref:Dipeptidyl aminopeptidase/acylaminoacyl peptidase n=1 Tax=Vulcaniibacterium tengchongense TaxID=1273429 RepID=A0A3N4VEE9_9GAMM|nr:S9 family peptidase [Vulcaniibacterium tengchongense]RPE79875.1 dipeptidyl aminopeptidase/acylaminoacyl peptidase [Vulcaniibacterium tengchongense]